LSQKFKIAIPVFNAENWISNNIEMLLGQTHTNFEACIINDASTDRTGEVIESYRKRLDSRFKIVHNDKNVGPLENQYNAWKNHLDSSGDPESVLITVDGDDWLYSIGSLQVLNAYYEKFNPLLTYGNHIHWPWGTRSNCEIIPEQILKNSDFRKYKFCTSHLRTFKSKVLDQIPFSYLCDENGKMYRCTGDVALMMAALEISNPRIIFIPEVLCIYNRVNPLSEDVTIQDEQARVEREIRLKKKLSRME
jgi:glycosyltransferase involved in cell wall biosynthesis